MLFQSDSVGHLDDVEKIPANKIGIHLGIASSPREFGAENQSKFIIPFDRDSKFIGRENVIQEVTIRFKTQRRVALCGIGGIG